MTCTECHKPFRHWLVEGHYTRHARPAAAQAAASLARHGVDDAYGTAALWKGYRGPFESKAACTAPKSLGYATSFVLDSLTDKLLPGLTGLNIPGLRPDATWHGGGVHAMRAGDFLATHIDYALHPKLDPPMERRLNLVYFLVPEWKERWGGALEFWDDDAREVVTRIYPAPGRAVLWEPGETTYHSVQRVADDCPAWRLTVNVFFVAPARPGCVRRRALFVPRREHETGAVP